MTTTPCRYCTTPTPMLATGLCDPCWHLRRALAYASPASIAAGVAVELEKRPSRLVELRDALTAVIDAPRLAARAKARTVSTDLDDRRFRLLRAAAGEWGVSDGAEVTWYSGEHAEVAARATFNAARGKVTCEDCDGTFPIDDTVAAYHDEAGRICGPCADKREAEFNTADFAHDEDNPGEDGCAWTGKGTEIKTGDEDGHDCPKCGGKVSMIDAPPVLVESADGAIAATPIADPPRFHVALLRDVPDGARVAPFLSVDGDAMPIAVEVCGILNASRSVRGGYAWHLVTADYRESMGAGTPCIVDTRPEVTP